MPRRLALFVLPAMFTAISAANADWHVGIQSKTVPPGATGVTVEIAAAHDLALSGLAIPIIVHESSDPAIGAFWTGTLPVYCGDNIHGVEWFFDDSGPVTTELCYNGGIIPLPGDGVSPDQFYISVSGMINPSPAEVLRARITFDVTNVIGEFEFDTGMFSASLCCIQMTDQGFPPADHGSQVAFDKGIITITDCDCTYLGDCNGDAAINPVDVIYMVNTVYRGGSPPPATPDCPAINGDWNCDNVINPVDVAEMVNFVYRNSDMPPCNPCQGGPLPDLAIGVDDIYLNPPSVPVGVAAGLWVNVRNIGRVTAVEPFLQIYQGNPLDESAVLLGEGIIGDIPPGAQSGFWGGLFTFDTPGTIEIYGAVDLPDEIVEVDENNNMNYRVLEVTQVSSGQEPVSRNLTMPAELRHLDVLKVKEE